MTIGRIPSVEGGIQPTIVDAKGDLIAGVAADSINRLAVGSNDQVLVADSSASTGLAWKSVATPFAAGKNIVINGDFRINQRSFASTTSNGVYGHDRWSLQTNSTCTYSTQTFTPGTAPVAGYEGVNFARMATTTNSSASEYAILQYKAEDVRTLAGQTATVSFWAKAASGTPKLGIELGQLFGSGGSSAVNGTGQAVTLSTSWTRYSVTISVPSVSGKTIGTGSYVEFNFWCSAGSSFNGRSGTVGNQSATIDIWGVQLEAGNVATPFQTATGTLQGELAACQRYYIRASAATLGKNFLRYANGTANLTTTSAQFWYLPVPMRIVPTTLETNTISQYILYDGVTTNTLSAMSIDSDSGNQVVQLFCSVTSGLTQYRPYYLTSNNNQTSYIGLSAEL